MPAQMTAQPTTIADGRACVARYAAVSVPTRRLLGIAQAYLDAGDTARARVTFGAMLQAVASRPATVRAWALYSVIDAYMSVLPALVPNALEYIRMLDALGPSMGGFQLLAHHRLYAYAAGIDDIPMMETHALAEVAASAALTGDARYDWASAMSGAYYDLADVYGRQEDAVRAVSTLRRGAVVVGDVDPSARESMLRGGDQFAIYGKPLPVIQSSFSYVPGSTTPRGPVVDPAKGKVALVVFVNKNCTLECYPAYAILRRLIESYGAKGLAVVLVTQTHGWDGERLVSSAKEEGELDRHFFYEDVHIPATLAVWESVFTRDTSDGSIYAAPQPNMEQFFYQSVLADRRGIIRQLVHLDQGMELRVRHMVEMLLGS
jgi:hypothetical protein